MNYVIQILYKQIKIPDAKHAYHSLKLLKFGPYNSPQKIPQEGGLPEPYKE